MAANGRGNRDSDYRADSPTLRVIIVGAGLSGLGAGIQSALSGHSVLILESAKELGEVRTQNAHIKQLNIKSCSSIILQPT